MTEIENYISHISSVRRYSTRTCEIYRDSLARFAEFCGEGFPSPDSFSVANVRNYEIHLLDTLGESPRTVNLHLSILSGFCKYLIKRGELRQNPVHLVSRPKTPKRLPTFYREESMKDYFTSTRFSSDEEALDFFLSLPSNDKTAAELYKRRLSRLVISILGSTGIRRSELIALNTNSLDFARKTLSVHGKGDKMREIPLTASLCKEISLYLKSTAKIDNRPSDDGQPLLMTFQGKRLYPVLVDRIVKSELSGVSGVTGRKSPHVLRHTLASELLDDGADLNSIKELLGHSSLAATQVYTHNSVERLKKVYTIAHPRAKK